ncbi:MAG: hypothetical protein GX231_03010 [Tissierellia bacterium]|nr:hypothetical protein [Tissierellia bacterium]
MMEREKFYISFSQTMSLITLVISVYLLLTNPDRSKIRTILLILWIALYIIDNLKTIKAHFGKNQESQVANKTIVENMSTVNYFISLLVVTLIKILVPFIING